MNANNPLKKLTILSLTLFILFSFSGRSFAQTNQAPKGIMWVPERKWKISENNYNWQGINSDAKQIQDAGITWVRINIYEKDPFTYMDQLLSITQQHNLQVLLRVMKSYPEKDLGDATQQANFQAWLSQAVNRYKGIVRYWEIHNEENIPPFWNINHAVDSDPVAYAQSVQNYVIHLRNSYQTIKSIDPSLLVLIGGLSEYRVERYIDELIKQNAYQYFDILSYHPYSNNPDAVIQRVKALEAKMKLQPELAAKPIWITEFGFHTNPDWKSKFAGYVADENIKADYLLQTMQKLSDYLQNGNPLFWYDLHEAGSAINGYGLVRKDNATLQTTFLPSYNAYRDLWAVKFLTIRTPLADSFVNKQAPNTNYGKANTIQVNNASTDSKIGYLKYDLSGLPGGNLTRARLKISVASSSNATSTSTQNIRLAANTAWQENLITYATRPAISNTTLGSFSNLSAPTWRYSELDPNALRPYLGSQVTLGIVSLGADDLYFLTKETSNPPQLLLYFTY